MEAMIPTIVGAVAALFAFVIVALFVLHLLDD